MKQPTLDYILSLHNIIVAKTEEIEHLTRMINIARSQYKTMNQAQLEEAIRDVAGMRHAIEDAKKLCKTYKKEVDAFFAPAA